MSLGRNPGWVGGEPERDGAYVFSVPVPPDVVKAIELALCSLRASGCVRVVNLDPAKGEDWTVERERGS